MDDSKGKIAVAAVALLLFLVLLPLFILTSAAEEEHNQSTVLTGCAALPTGEQMIVPPEYQDAINEAAKTANFPAGVIAAQLFTESRFDPNAYQPSSGASGIAQFIPATWAAFGNGADPFDPFAGIDAMGRYMVEQQRLTASLVTNDRERIELALAGYNAGHDEVLRAGGIPPIPETTNYVQQIMTLAQMASGAGCQVPGGDVIGNVGTGAWTHPLPGSYVTSLFGRRSCIAGLECDTSIQQHDGLDMSTSGGPGIILAATDMRITFVTDEWAQGALVMGEIPDDPSVEILYVHCVQGSHRVREGQTVAAGTPLCTEGQTGRASAPHLHLEIRKNGTPVDPEPILLSKGVPLRYNPGVR